MTERGLFVVVEGCDRAGKSTQCERLVQRLLSENKNAQLCKFPDRTTQTGKMIDNYLKQATHLDDHAIHLLFSANRWEAMESLEKLLRSGTTVIVDRYAYSGVAFSSAKGLDITWCKQPDVGLLRPDLVLFLDLDIKEAELRGGFGMERYETRELQIKVRQQFSKLRDDTWKIISAAKSVEEVHEEMWKILSDAMKASGERQELSYSLWK